MARYLPNDAGTLNPCTLPPRVRFEPESVVDPPHARFGLGKEIQARSASEWIHRLVVCKVAGTLRVPFAK
jgi:hypothetical protein